MVVVSEEAMALASDGGGGEGFCNENGGAGGDGGEGGDNGREQKAGICTASSSESYSW